ncbi:MAG: hypothetical protein ACOX8W_13020 [bacterium]
MSFIEFFPYYMAGIWTIIKIAVASFALACMIMLTLVLAGATLRRALR